MSRNNITKEWFGVESRTGKSFDLTLENIAFGLYNSFGF